MLNEQPHYSIPSKARITRVARIGILHRIDVNVTMLYSVVGITCAPYLLQGCKNGHQYNWSTKRVTGGECK